MDGILIINKQSGMTSHDVVAVIRRILKTKKVGHTGTLDPEATGVLVACVGKATKLSGFLMATSKEYIAEMQLGIRTDSQDSTGKIVSRTNNINVTREQVEQVLGKLTGEINQIPPMVSAVRHHGKKLYELARKGQEVKREPRKVKIYSLELLKFEPPKIAFKVECSKGTYIRTLCSDIGEMVGCGAHQASLIRTRTGPFKIDNSLTLDELENLPSPEEKIIPPEKALSFLPEVKVKKWFRRFIAKNAELTSADIIKKPDLAGGETVRITDPEGVLLAVGKAYSPGDESEAPVTIVHCLKTQE
jgi:tRNA pseudouridine55 synthase